jgi:hypothetical protein
MRAPAKRYVASLGFLTALEPIPPARLVLTEPAAVEWLIEVHRRYRRERAPELAASWFGRLLWKLFGRWL